MSEFSTMALYGVLGACILFAEINLLRIFVSDWIRGAREQRRKVPRRGQRTKNSNGLGRAESRPSRGLVAGLIGIPLWITNGVHAQTPASPATADANPQNANELLSASQSTKSPFSLQLNLDYTTAYFYHGIIQEDTGLILQPSARLNINLLEAGDLKIDAILGVWNSFHGQKTGARTHSDFTDYWYESDLIGGLVITKGKVSLTTTYTFLTSPSDAYETVQELDLTLAYDDSDLLGKFALHPCVLLGIETGADASDGGDSDAGKYLEIGVAPGISFDWSKTPISISFPLSVGMSLNNYYQDAEGEDDTFGFVQVGVKGSVPLPFGERWGKWTLNAGVSALFLGDHTEAYNGGQSEQFIGTLGVQVNF